MHLAEKYDYIVDVLVAVLRLCFCSQISIQEWFWSLEEKNIPNEILNFQTEPSKPRSNQYNIYYTAR